MKNGCVIIFIVFLIENLLLSLKVLFKCNFNLFFGLVNFRKDSDLIV